ncbi:MAG TPA: hypothetical protein VKA84_01845 [Gemmatimonadaceae bacterium]|nr:hypothetical protein [Gemmatimonadaceae bacterium]
MGPLAVIFVLAAAAPAGLRAAVRFGFGRDASVELTRLWAESIAAHEERVACMAAERRDGGWSITAIRELAPSGADSASISSAASLRECRPPEWVGTVHTHIAIFDGQPFTTFSASDRQVMTRWRKRWEMEGVFCVLYSETMAHCEGDGDDSEDMVYAAAAPARPAPQRGNVILGGH